MISPVLYLGYMIAGLTAGLLSGLLGIGGGVILVPLLHLLFIHQGIPSEYMMQLAAGTSLATVALITGSASIAHHQYHTVRWDFLRYLLPGLGFGALLGSFLADKAPTDLLQCVFAIVLTANALRILFISEKGNTIERAPSWVTSVLATGVGSLSGLIGIGGGILLVPLLRAFGLVTKQVVSTSATATFFVALMGMCGALWFGQNSVDVAMATGYVYWPAVMILGMTGILAAPLGVYLSHHLPVKLLKQVFAVLLLFVAWRLFHSIHWDFLLTSFLP